MYFAIRHCLLLLFLVTFFFSPFSISSFCCCCLKRNAMWVSSFIFHYKELSIGYDLPYVSFSNFFLTHIFSSIFIQSSAFLVVWRRKEFGLLFNRRDLGIGHIMCHPPSLPFFTSYTYSVFFPVRPPSTYGQTTASPDPRAPDPHPRRVLSSRRVTLPGRRRAGAVSSRDC